MAAETSNAQILATLLLQHQPCLVLTGAGVSSESGLGTYRDDKGEWMRKQPITAQAFLGSLAARQRYWARSYVGWQDFNRARPNANHQVLLQLKQLGLLTGLVTQNVDGLHTLAGHPGVIDLHGTIHEVKCMDCNRTTQRSLYQQQMLSANPRLEFLTGSSAPDGDSDLDGDNQFDWLQPPACNHCAGVMKPDVVFFGENVVRDKVDQVYSLLDKSQMLLIVGSSLMIFSGYRFARRAKESGKQLAILNRGVTRADELADVLINQESSEILSQALNLIQQQATDPGFKPHLT